MQEPRLVTTHDTDLPLHPVAELFPEMEADQYEGLRADITANGVLEPVEVHQGKIIDGRHRWKIAKEMHMACPIVDYAGDEQDLAAYVVSKNLHRRHMSASVRAMVGVNLQLYANKIEQGRHRGGRGTKGSGQGRARADAAKAVDVSETYIKQAQVVKTKDPKLAEEVASGKTSLNRAYQQLKDDPPPLPVKVKDQTGRDLDDPEIAESYKQSRAAIASAIARLDQAGREARSLIGTAAGAFINEQQLGAELKTLRRILASATPYAECPYCRAGCDACRQQGWVPKYIYEPAPKDLK